MTDPREEIKRLADRYAHWHKEGIAEAAAGAMAALYAAIDAMPLGNLTDAALEGAPSCPICSGDCSSANPPVLNCPMRGGFLSPAEIEAMVDSVFGPADNAGSDEPEGNSQ